MNTYYSDTPNLTFNEVSGQHKSFIVVNGRSPRVIIDADYEILDDDAQEEILKAGGC